MIIKLSVLFFFIGVMAGVINRYTPISRSILSLTCGYFFLPVLGINLASFYPYLLASVLVACLPVCLYVWLKKLRHVEPQKLVFKYAPGISMGAVVGAQLVSILSYKVLIIVLSVFLFSLLLIQSYRLISHVNGSVILHSHVNKWLKALKPLPLGMFLGTGAVLFADDCHTVSKSVLDGADSHQPDNQNGLSVFVCFAAMIGFVFPAVQPVFIDVNVSMDWFAGLVCLPISMSLAAGLFIAACFPAWTINDFEKKFISFCIILYLVICLIRIWF
ncbi:hypothetical protein [Marinomonas sp. THO17]|uniref:hypothetical protein n=1 Tax=Marinomonas sp. THO17 TaxID=3149048 RepID=UPI00336BC111